MYSTVPLDPQTTNFEIWDPMILRLVPYMQKNQPSDMSHFNFEGHFYGQSPSYSCRWISEIHLQIIGSLPFPVPSEQKKGVNQNQPFNLPTFFPTFSGPPTCDLQSLPVWRWASDVSNNFSIWSQDAGKKKAPVKLGWTWSHCRKIPSGYLFCLKHVHCKNQSVECMISKKNSSCYMSNIIYTTSS